jgi:hypothetical protein
MPLQPSNSNSKPATTRQIVGIVFGLAFCIALFAGIIYFVKANVAAKREAILKNPGYATGIITRVRTYKKKRISVRYIVNGMEYSLGTRVTRTFLRTHKKGDTTAVIYSKADPSNALLKAKLRSSTN